MRFAIHTPVLRALALCTALSALAILPATASARLTVCNNYSKRIWYTNMFPASICEAKFWQVGWWKIPAGQCVQIFSESMVGKRIFWHAIADDGHPMNGAGVGSLPVPQDDHSNCTGIAVWNQVCSTTPNGCMSRPHKVVDISTTNHTIQFP